MPAAQYAGKAALVTGGLGFIGSNLTIRLVEAGADVTVVDARVPESGANEFNLDGVASSVRIERVDVRDRAAIDTLVADRDVLFQLAGHVSHVESMTDPVSDLELNCHAQLALLEAWRNVNPGARFVFAASRQQYGRPVYLPLDEQHPLVPVDVNGIHKTAAEAALLLYTRVYGLAGCSLRLTNTYGPRMQMRHPRQGFIPWFVRLALDDACIELYGGGLAVRDFNYVDDVVDALLLVGSDPRAVGEVFNLGHPKPATLRTFAETLIDVAGTGSLAEVPFPEDRARIDIGSVYADFTKIRLRLGWEPRVDLRDGLARMVAYYREHRGHYW